MHGCLLLSFVEVLLCATAVHLVFLLVTMVDQRVHLLDQTTELLLLRVKLVLEPIETDHHVAKLLVSLLLIRFFTSLTSVEDVELVLELRLHHRIVSSLLVLLFTVDGDEVGKVWSLLALANLDDDSHDDILQRVFAVALLIGETHDIAGHMQHIVTGELALLLQDLVLVDEQIAAEWLVLVFLDQFLHLCMVEHEEFNIGLASEVHVHVVLHEESAVIDSRTLVELLNNELVVLKLSVGLKHALLDEVEGVSGVFFGKHDRIFLVHFGHKTEHEIKENLIFMLSQILDSLDHTKHKLNFLVPVAFDGVVLQSNFIFGELRYHLTESRLVDAGKGVVIIR